MQADEITEMTKYLSNAWNKAKKSNWYAPRRKRPDDGEIIRQILQRGACIGNSDYIFWESTWFTIFIVSRSVKVSQVNLVLTWSFGTPLRLLPAELELVSILNSSDIRNSSTLQLRDRQVISGQFSCSQTVVFGINKFFR
jgi:hypothetical protein